MKQSQLLQHFELLAQTENAPQKLRQIVIDLAASGRLVSQCANEGEGHQLVKLLGLAGGKFATKYSVEGVDELRITIPPSWGAVPLADAARPNGLFADGDWIESKDQDPSGENRLVQLADVGVGRYKDRSARFVNDETAKRSDARSCKSVTCS
jgi:type I restriction enzyme S subunit